MKIQTQSERKLRTRQLIQIGGLVQKSGILDALSIAPGEDLQSYENLPKASQLLGFFTETFEKTEFNEAHFKNWQKMGERVLRG